MFPWCSYCDWSPPYGVLGTLFWFIAKEKYKDTVFSKATHAFMTLIKKHKNETFLGSYFEFCTISSSIQIAKVYNIQCFSVL
jgi:hypothetical protein